MYLVAGQFSLFLKGNTYVFAIQGIKYYLSRRGKIVQPPGTSRSPGTLIKDALMESFLICFNSSLLLWGLSKSLTIVTLWDVQNPIDNPMGKEFIT